MTKSTPRREGLSPLFRGRMVAKVRDRVGPDGPEHDGMFMVHDRLYKASYLW